MCIPHLGDLVFERGNFGLRFGQLNVDLSDLFQKIFVKFGICQVELAMIFSCMASRVGPRARRTSWAIDEGVRSSVFCFLDEPWGRTVMDSASDIFRKRSIILNVARGGGKVIGGVMTRK